jgi:hypothetical protein
MPRLLLINNNGYVDDRAVLNTVSATCAKIHIDAPRPFLDFYFEIPGRSLDRLEIRIGNDFDVEMPADLDQFG